AAAVGVGGGGQRELGRHHDLVALAGEEAAEDLLALAVRVVVGGVDEGAARLPEGGVDLPARGLVGTEAPAGAEGHRAQAGVAHPQAGSAQDPLVEPHRQTPPSPDSSMSSSPIQWTKRWRAYMASCGPPGTCRLAVPTRHTRW